MYISLKTKTLPLGKVFRQKHDLCGCLHYGWVRTLASHTYRNSDLHSPLSLTAATLFWAAQSLPCPCTVWPSAKNRQRTCMSMSGDPLHISFFFFLTTLTHIFHTYYDPQTHFCLLNKIFNFVELHLHPFQPYMYSQVKRKSRPRAHFICFSSHTAPRPCCQLYSVILFGYFV